MEHHLPPEILMQIFSACCSEQCPIQTSVAVYLSQICTRWRAIVLSMPNLWASFSIQLGQLNRGGFGQDADRSETISRLLHLHLERSATYPLSFDADFQNARVVSPPALSLLAALVEHSTRWASVILPLSPAVVPVLGHINSRLDRLENLRLRMKGSADPDAWADCKIFQTAPRLRRLTLGSSPSMLPFPTTQLTELHLGAIATFKMVQFMTRSPCPNLTRLTLTPYYEAYPTSQSLPSLPVFRHLHTLVLAIRDGYSRNPVIEVLGLLTAPTLKNLQVAGMREIRLPRQSFASFLQRSVCKLENLTLDFQESSKVLEFIGNFEALPSLAHLVLVARGKDVMRAVGRMLQSLNLSNNHIPMLPNLVSIDLQTVDFHNSILDVAESRINGTAHGSRLKILILRNAPDTEFACTRLHLLEARGLQVSYFAPCKTPDIFL
ncbi:hypothetical protein B0H10DRAFT_835322 [Mycena sp. CBHHK59/15]|nr:hypothetical protein B0H10DRAFT_835322 [Mycena sp. CBHHK59/15]